jgi:amino acid transporter
MVVWAALCIAFIRYEKWLAPFHPLCQSSQETEPSYPRPPEVVWLTLSISRLEICDNGLKAQHSHYRRQSPQYKSYTFLSWAQPYIAWLGLIGCVLVFSFTSAMWWSSPANLTKVAIAYAVVRPLFPSSPPRRLLSLSVPHP